MMKLDGWTVICTACNWNPPASQEPIAKDRSADMLALEEGLVVSGPHQLDEPHRDGSLPHEFCPSRKALLQAVPKQYRIHLDGLERQALCDVEADEDIRQ